MKDDNHYTYAVVEDVEEVRAAIVSRMSHFENWNCVCNTAYYHIALENISVLQPQLLFLDYSILGGNTFMLLNEIESIDGYHPYVVFFTAYMSDQPEIAEQLLNQYSSLVKVFLNKPIFQKLDQQLEKFLQDAILRYKQQQVPLIWIKTIENQKIQLDPGDITCFSQALNPRNKIVHISNSIQYEFKATWSLCEQLAIDHHLHFEYANSRHYFVNMNTITSIKRPFIWLKDDLKIIVTKERWSIFKQFLESKY